MELIRSTTGARTLVARLLLAVAMAAPALHADAQDLQYRSGFLSVTMAADQPNFTMLSVDSLGKGKLSVNAMLPLTGTAHYTATRNGD